MREVVEFVRANDAYFLLGLAGLSLILLVCNVSLFCKFKALTRRRNAKLEDGRVGDIIDCLTEQYANLEKLRNELAGIGKNQHEHAKLLANCLKNVGVVRFDAFEDVGGEQSFAAALVDSDRTGIILSGLFGRQDSRLYAKGIVNGEADRALSDEEHRALEKAVAEQPRRTPGLV
jgi:hypothetical protein